MKAHAVGFMVVALTFLVAGAAAADPVTPDPSVDATLLGAVASQSVSSDELDQNIATAPTGTIYDVQIKCASSETDAVCDNPITCDVPPGSVRYDVLVSTDGGQTFTKISEACLTNPPDGGPPVVTAALVARQFKALAWPESPLTIQPPGGRTLVNLETNFFTTNTAPTTQTVTLLGQQVDIEAAPTGWTWRHGDGTSQSTDQPGAAYPALTITHTYRDADVTVTPSVDTTYSGRYRVGGGAWNPIPATVTVAGAAGQLEVVPAAPQLVAPQ